MDDAEQSQGKSVSLQKLEANRRNALKSTGPKTEEGKRAVRDNAVKHGFYAKQILLSNLEDDPEEFASLLEQLRESHRSANSRSCWWNGSASVSGRAAAPCAAKSPKRNRVPPRL